MMRLILHVGYFDQSFVVKNTLIFMFNHLTYVPNCIQCIMVYRQVYQLQVQVLSKNKPNEPISTVSTWKFNVICFQAARLESTLEASFFRQYVFLYIKKLSHIFIEVAMLFFKNETNYVGRIAFILSRPGEVVSFLGQVNQTSLKQKSHRKGL